MPRSASAQNRKKKTRSDNSHSSTPNASLVAAPPSPMPAEAQRFSMFLRGAPADATRCVVLAYGVSDIVLVDIPRDAVEREGVERIAMLTLDAAREYAESERRECRFAAQWRTEHGDVRATHSWRAGTSPGLTLDGSDDSLVVQMQGHVERLVVAVLDDGLANLTKAWKETLSESSTEKRAWQNRCVNLERENAELRAKLERAKMHEHDLREVELALEAEKSVRAQQLVEKLLPVALAKFGIAVPPEVAASLASIAGQQNEKGEHGGKS